MRKTTGTLKGIPLTLHLAESKDEKTAGYNSVPIRNGEGMLFQFGAPDFIPVDVSGLDKKLDALFLVNGTVYSILQRMPDTGGHFAGFGNAVLEVPAGWTQQNGIRVGDTLDCAELVKVPETMKVAVDALEAMAEGPRIQADEAKKKESRGRNRK